MLVCFSVHVLIPRLSSDSTPCWNRYSMYTLRSVMVVPMATSPRSQVAMRLASRCEKTVWRDDRPFIWRRRRSIQ